MEKALERADLDVIAGALTRLLGAVRHRVTYMEGKLELLAALRDIAVRAGLQQETCWFPVDPGDASGAMWGKVI